LQFKINSKGKSTHLPPSYITLEHKSSSTKLQVALSRLNNIITL